MPANSRRRAPNFVNVPAEHSTWEVFKQTAKQKVASNSNIMSRRFTPDQVTRNEYWAKPENFELYAFGTSTAGTCAAFVAKIRALNFEVFFKKSPDQANYAMSVTVIARNQTTCDWRQVFCLFENLADSHIVGPNGMNFFWDN